MLRRLPSVSSISSFLRSPSTSTASDTDRPLATPTTDFPTSSLNDAEDSSLSEALSTSLLPSASASASSSSQATPAAPPPRPPADPLSLANASLISALELLQSVPRWDYNSRLALLAEVYLILSDVADSRNTFRECGGFLSAISVLSSLDEGSVMGFPSASSPTIPQPHETEGEEKGLGSGVQGSKKRRRSKRQKKEDERERRELRFELVKLVFQILTIVFEGPHEQNKAAFKDLVGFEAVGEAIKLSGLMESPSGDSGGGADDESEGEKEEEEEDRGGGGTKRPVDKGWTPQEGMLGILWGFLTGDWASPMLFGHLRLQLISSLKAAEAVERAMEATRGKGQLEDPEGEMEPVSEIGETNGEVEERGEDGDSSSSSDEDRSFKDPENGDGDEEEGTGPSAQPSTSTSVSTSMPSVSSPVPLTSTSKSPTSSNDDKPLPSTSRTKLITHLLRTRFSTLHSHHSSAPSAENPEILPLLLELQGSLDVQTQGELRFMVLLAVRELVKSERRGQVAVAGAGGVGIGLERLILDREVRSGKGKNKVVDESRDGEGEGGGNQEMEEEEKALWRELVVNLLEMGAGTKETRLLFQSVVKGWKENVDGNGEETLDEDMLDIILQGVRQSRLPPFLHFDLSRHGYSSVSMKSLGRTFPPPTHGYTFLAWISIVSPPSRQDERLIVFGCGDATGKCHVEASISPDLHFTLATSHTKPSVTFSTFRFELNRFYHVGIVHQRPKYSSNSPVSLYIDGKLVEVGKAAYPQAPPKDWEVQAWLGTPKDRVPAGRSGRGKSQLKWDLGPSWLIHGDVPEEMVYVCSTLGPRYASNFQDQLGQFQTNMSSTLLNVRLDTAARAGLSSAQKQHNTPLVYAIRDKGSAVIPEHRIIFAFSALNVLVSGSGRGISGSGLSEHAQQALSLATASRGKVVVNSAIPRMEDALIQPHGLGFLGGEPCVANPKGLDVAIWKIGGVAVALRLVELAATASQLAKAVQLVVELIKESWRNSEDTERMQGYEILSLLLRSKAELMSVETHDALLSFVGYDFVNPERSVVSSQLAFRFIALDFALWGNVDRDIQKLHFDRLRQFASRSVHREFNTRRISKMHMTRKVLFALRARYFTDYDMVGELVDTFAIIVRAHFTTETIRHVATFLAATLCQVQDSIYVESTASSVAAPHSIRNPARSFVLDASQVDQGNRRSSLLVLKSLHDILLSSDADTELAKFGKTITQKWMLLFLLDKHAHPLSAIYAARILVRLLQTQGPAYVTKFVQSFDGFSVLRGSMSHLWNYAQIHLTLFALLHGHDITTLPLDAPFSASAFALSATSVSPVAPEVVRVIIAAIGKGLQVLSYIEFGEPAASIIPVVAVSGPDEQNTTVPADAEVRNHIEGHEEDLPVLFLSLSSGFELMLDLLAQTDRSVGTSHKLIASPSPFRDLTSALLPYLPVPVSELSGVEATPIPTLSALNNFCLPPTSTSAPQSPVNGDISTTSGLFKLVIPAFQHLMDERSTSPMSAVSAVDEDGHAEVLPLTTLGAAATSVVQFLSHQVALPIMSQYVQRQASNLPLEGSPDPSLQVLHTLLSSVACGDSPQQVAFRTLLVKDVCRRLVRASALPAVATRVAAFAGFMTDFSFQGMCNYNACFKWYFPSQLTDSLLGLGWNSDVKGMVDFVLTYLEKLLDVSGMGGEAALTDQCDLLFRCLNRLILLSLVDGKRDSYDVNSLLVRHQLSIFSPRNGDGFFFRCLIQRLDSRLRAMADNDRATTIGLFKLLIVQRPQDLEAALAYQRRHASEAGIAETLLNTDDDGFVALLKEYQERLNQLSESWLDFVEMEDSRARLAVEIELSRVADVVKVDRQKQDLQQRRARKERNNIYEWSEGIHEVEATRVAHTRQDIADLSTFVQAEWDEQHRSLRRGCGIWDGSVANRRWRLDFTEGFCRTRKKLHAEDVVQHRKTTELHPAIALEGHSRSLGATRQDAFTIGHTKFQVDSGGANSPISSPMTPQEDSVWGETFAKPFNAEAAANAGAAVAAALASQDADPDAPLEEDKNRKVRRNLEPGDVILSVFNVSRIVGLDACPGLLLIAKKNIYIVDSFFQKANGELVDAKDAPEDERDQHLQTLADLAGRNSSPAATPAVDAGHRTRRWSWAELLTVHERKFLFRNVALELFFADGRSFLLTFATDERHLAHENLAKACPAAVAFGSLNVTGASFGAKVTDAFLGHRTKLDKMTRRWERREVTNFEYLMFLNTCAGRTYNDLTNYPVFPWIIADYTSETLDLTNPATFRDLSKPMGAQTEERAREFQDRYAQMLELDDGTKPFHYGTHYSSAMIVVGYMVRLRPFTESYLDLQGGNFDHADRMFWSIAKTWESSSKQSGSDVRELIPEFFYLPDFLRNADSLELGTRQDGNARIDNVELPPWAGNDPRRFVELNREALESEYVSQHLGSWIDLIFGCRQTGEAAVEACNVFHHLSYEGAIDLDKIEDVNERKAATLTIHSFGMTPRAIFSKPHPQRTPPLVAKATRPLFSPDNFIEHQTAVLIQCIVPIFELGQQVGTIYPAGPELTSATPSQSLLVPGDTDHTLSWGFTDQTLRVHAKGNSLPLSLFENMHSEFVSAAAFADDHTIATGSTDTSVSLWQWKWRLHGQDGHFQQLECLRGHSDQVSCIAASRAFSIVVSGSDDRTAIIWDLNRHRFVHRLEGHESRVHAVAIFETTGDVITCSGAVLRVWSVNGVLLATQSTSNFVDPITSVAVSLSETQPIIAAGHRNGRVTLWRRDFAPTEKTGWRLTLLQTLQHKDRVDLRSPADVTALAFTQRTLYTGDAAGRVWLWNPPGTEMFLSDSVGGGICLHCSPKTLLGLRWIVLLAVHDHKCRDRGAILFSMLFEAKPSHGALR